jgi:histidyl-tRNA synthetase
MTDKKVKPARLKGFQDYDPRTMALRYRVTDVFRRVAQRGAFEPMGTPALEYSEVLLGVGGETDKQVFRFIDNGDRDVALRFDLTVPFARYVAEHRGEMVFPFKRYQIGDVWRAEKPQKGRYREFGQCDLDIVGTDSLLAEVEVVSAFIEILQELGIGGFTVRINHRGFLTAVIEECFPSREPGHMAEILIAIDKLEKIGPSGVQDLLLAKGFEIEGIRRLLVLLESPDALKSPESEKARGELQKLQELLGDKKHLVQVDHRIVRGLGYYTGLIFETTLDALPGFGSICSGGRYDGLVERFSREPLSGVGASLGLDRLVAASLEMGEDGGLSVPEDPGVFIALAGDSDGLLAYALGLLGRIRKAGVRAEIALKPGKLPNQFKYAHKKGYAFVMTLGEDERAAGTFSWKNMALGTEERGLPQGELLSYLPSRAMGMGEES